MNKKIEKKIRKLNVNKVLKEQQRKLSLLTLAKMQFLTV